MTVKHTYLKKIGTIFRQVASLGIEEGMKDRKKIKIRLLNKVAFLAIVLTFINMLVSGLYYGSYIEVLRKIGAPTASFIILYLHSKGYYRIPKFIVCYLFPLWLCIITVSGIGNGTELILICICAILSFIQYEGQQHLKLLSLGYIVSLLLGVGVLIYSLHPARITEDTFFLTLLLVLIPCIILIYFLLEFYHNDIRRLSLQKDRLVQQLQNKNEELERFAYVTSHDLKEPVRNIQSFAGILKKKFTADANRQKEVRLVQVIDDSATRMVTMIDSILKFSKLDQQELPMGAVDLDHLLNEFKNTHKQFLAEKKAVLNYMDTPSIYGNKLFLSLLFQNLIENGIKYNESSPPTIDIEVDIKNDYANISVRDNGIGIEEEFKDHIFEPFKRLHNRTKYKGTGLGLSICKKIVDAHAGKIWVESDGHSGSTVRVQLPTNMLV